MKGTQIADTGFGYGAPHPGRISGGGEARDVKSATDEELVLRLKRDGDEEAFNEMVDRHADVIFRLALGITLNAGDAGEVLQEAFLAIETPDTFREDAKFSTWFYRIALNLCLSRLGADKEHKRNESMDEYPPCRGYGVLEVARNGGRNARPEDTVCTQEGLRKIEYALGELPAGYRAVFQLRDVEGFSNREVAEILGLSVPGVKSRIHRARFLLRKRLSDYFYQPEKNCRAGAG